MTTPGSGNPWFGVSMGLLGLIVGYVVANGMGPSIAAPTPTAPTAAAPTAAAPTPTATADNVPKVDKAVDHIRGNPDAKISVIEYSDFECPFCQRHHPTMQQVVDTYGDDVNWVYRHYPLSFHPMAQKAAEASECAAEFGGNDMFWKYADMLFERGPDNTKLAAYAKELGMDEAKFQACVDSGKYAQKTADEMQGGSTAGVQGTPGNIVINNETGETALVSGAVPFQNFQSVIDGML